jgi:hypothetical protein
MIEIGKRQFMELDDLMSQEFKDPDVLILFLKATIKDYEEDKDLKLLVNTLGWIITCIN